MSKRTVQKSLNEDIHVVLADNPGLMVLYNDDTPVELYGTYILRDDQDSEQGRWEVRITIPASYPYGFPDLFETSNLIPCIPDRHMGEDRKACLELPILKRSSAKIGLTLNRFIEDYVKKYFSWQVVYEYGDRDKLVSWGHGLDGIEEYFYEKLSSRDHAHIFWVLENYTIGQEPERNSPCYCQAGKKYKACHGRILSGITYDLGKNLIKVCKQLFQPK